MVVGTYFSISDSYDQAEDYLMSITLNRDDETSVTISDLETSQERELQILSIKYNHPYIIYLLTLKP